MKIAVKGKKKFYYVCCKKKKKGNSTFKFISHAKFFVNTWDPQKPQKVKSLQFQPDNQVSDGRPTAKCPFFLAADSSVPLPIICLLPQY